MESGEQTHLRLVRPDESGSLSGPAQAGEDGRLQDGTMADRYHAFRVEAEIDRFEPVGMQAVLSEAVWALLNCLRNLESSHRDILQDGEYVQRKMALCNLEGCGNLDFTEVQDVFHWLYGAVSGHFDQVAEQYELYPQRGLHHQGSAKSYLPGTFDDLLKGVFTVAKSKYYQEAISAAAALIICGKLPAGLRQVVNEWREAVLRKIMMTIRQTDFVSDGREVSCMRGFRYQQDGKILGLLKFSNAGLLAYLGKCNTPLEKSTVFAIFAVRAAVTATCAEDTASRIANLTPLSIVR